MLPGDVNQRTMNEAVRITDEAGLMRPLSSAAESIPKSKRHLNKPFFFIK